MTYMTYWPFSCPDIHFDGSETRRIELSTTWVWLEYFEYSYVFPTLPWPQFIRKARSSKQVVQNIQLVSS